MPPNVHSNMVIHCLQYELDCARTIHTKVHSNVLMHCLQYEVNVANAFAQCTCERVSNHAAGTERAVMAGADSVALPCARAGLGRVKDSPHWCGVYGAYWRRPEGPDSSIKGKGHYPAVHTSWNDAVAFCNWAVGRSAIWTIALCNWAIALCNWARTFGNWAVGLSVSALARACPLLKSCLQWELSSKRSFEQCPSPIFKWQDRHIRVHPTMRDETAVCTLSYDGIESACTRVAHVGQGRFKIRRFTCQNLIFSIFSLCCHLWLKTNDSDFFGSSQ